MATATNLNGKATRTQAESAARSLVAGIVKSDPDSIRRALTLSVDAFSDRQHREVIEAAHKLDDLGCAIDATALMAYVDPSLLAILAEPRISLDPKRDARIVGEWYKAETLKRRIESLRDCDPDELRDVIADIDIPACPDSMRRPIDILAWRQPAPHRQFIFAGVLVQSALCALVAAGGSGKSWFTLTLAVSLATGRSFLAEFIPTRAAKVLWIESEDAPDELHRRFDALAKFYELTDDERSLLEQNLIIYAGEAFPLIDADGQPTRAYTWLRNTIRENQPRLIILDPFAHYFAGDENANPAVAAWCNAILDAGRLSRNNPAIIVAHHTSKAAQNVSDSASARGASSFRDHARCVINQTPLHADEIAKYGIVEPGRFVKVEITKANYAAKPPKPSILQRGEGGVLFDFDAESAEKEISGATVDQVVEALVRELGANSKDLSRRDIVSQPAGKWLRDLVKESCPGATRKTFEAAFDAAEMRGLIEVQIVETDGARRVVPRQRAATRTDGLRDE